MKINEVLEPSEQALFEAIDAENDSGIATQDVVDIVKARRSPYSQVTADEFQKLIREWANGEA